MIELTEKPIDPKEIYNRISKDVSGSVMIHFGMVKPIAEGKRTKGIQFVPDGDMEGEMRQVEAELREKWDIEDVLFICRIGNLNVGEVIAVTAIAADGRHSAFDACRDAVEKYKNMKSIKKKELF
ncbi:MAG: molybdenum cofactor biosynthesis protein MoaE [Candidatus Omnitrophica bacterium]|nr:molybdenum cofactor biosynthesis protein MoaE [Candidatus Omnitrophota bacterium]